MLQRRRHRFVHCADAMIILVKSDRAAQRVMQSITQYLEQLGLSAVRVWQLTASLGP